MRDEKSIHFLRAHICKKSSDEFLTLQLYIKVMIFKYFSFPTNQLGLFSLISKLELLIFMELYLDDAITCNCSRDKRHETRKHEAREDMMNEVRDTRHELQVMHEVSDKSCETQNTKFVALGSRYEAQETSHEERETTCTRYRLLRDCWSSANRGKRYYVPVLYLKVLVTHVLFEAVYCILVSCALGRGTAYIG